MGTKKPAPDAGPIELDLGEANPKQKLFYASRTLYTAYGGAKGGGKTHAVRVKAAGGAQKWPGIKILVMRATYKDLERNHIEPLLRMVPKELYSYNGTSHRMKFTNGSMIEFGHWQGERSENEYSGIEYDWIFLDEATQFSYRAFQFLGGCLRGANSIPKRMYLTCNPGGVGHRWVKRLFIDRIYNTSDPDPEARENPADYTFIPATVEDNVHLLNSPGGANYRRMLANMPDNLKRAYRYGDWNALGGSFFPEFSPKTHVRAPFELPAHWPRYRSFDYGLDKLACYWFAVDEDGRSWCYREVTETGLIVREAAKRIAGATRPDEGITATYAPPDMWSRQKDSGKTMAELFTLCGVPVVKSDNNRVQGAGMMKDLLAPGPVRDPAVRKLCGGDCEKLPMLLFFPNCKEIIGDMQDIQADPNNPNDCAKEPHEVTHTVDGVRYYAVMRTLRAQTPQSPAPPRDEAGEDEDYEDYMRGGEAERGYIDF